MSAPALHFLSCGSVVACGPGSPSCWQNTVSWPAVLSVLGTLVSLWPQDTSPVRREQPEGGPSSPRGGHLAFSLLPALLSCFGLHPASPSDVMVFSLSSRLGGPLVTLMCAWGPAARLQTAFSIHFLLPRPEWPWCFYQSRWQDQAGHSDVFALVL